MACRSVAEREPLGVVGLLIPLLAYKARDFPTFTELESSPQPRYRNGMDQLLKPEGDVVAEHRASVAWRTASVVLLGIPAALWITAAWSGPRENAAALSIPGAVLIGLCVLVFVQQGKVFVVLRTDGLERWGLRGELWTLRWEDATQLCYQATRVHAVGLDLFLLLKLFPALGKSVKIGFVDVNGKRRKLPSSLKAMDLLAERVIEHHTAAQFPVLRSALDRGEEVRFGKSLSLDREQISVRKLFGGMKRCLLSDVEKVSIDDGKLKIRQRGKTFAFAGFAVGSVPNAFLFVKLFDSARPGSGAAAPGQRAPRPGLRNVG